MQRKWRHVCVIYFPFCSANFFACGCRFGQDWPYISTRYFSALVSSGFPSKATLTFLKHLASFLSFSAFLMICHSYLSAGSIIYMPPTPNCKLVHFQPQPASFFRKISLNNEQHPHPIPSLSQFHSNFISSPAPSPFRLRPNTVPANSPSQPIPK